MHPELATPAYDSVVLGGGVAGIAAALHLAAAGHAPLLLEAAPTLGGRVRSFGSPFPSINLDTGPHLLTGGCLATLDLLERLGTRHLLTPLADNVRLDFWTPAAGPHHLHCPHWPAPLHLALGILTFQQLSPRERLISLRLALALKEPLERIETQSVTHWLTRHGQTPELLRRLWEPLCLATLNEPPGSANAALFATVLRESFLVSREGARLYLPNAPLERLFAHPAERALTQQGGAIRTRHRVLALDVQHGRLQRIVTTQGDFAVADVPVISALDHRSLAHLLPDWANAIGFNQLQTSPIVSVTLRYQQQAQLPSPLLGLPEQTSQWLFDLSALRGLRHQGSLFAAVLSAAYRESHWTPERLVATVHRDIAAILPTLDQETPQGVVRKERHATFAAWPGCNALRPGPKTPWSNLFLAGDWTATALPATIEGAVRSGIQAARMGIT